MRRLLAPFVVLLCLCIGRLPASAQPPARLEPGDPPRADRITVSAPDENGVVSVAGTAGSVFPTAYVAVRNLYTQETTFTQAGVMGSFRVSLWGTENTPFLIVPNRDAPPQNANFPGSLPGGPGTIVYAPFTDDAAEGVPFAVAGRLGGDLWSMRGQANTLALEPSDSFRLSMDVTADTDVAVSFSAQLLLQPIATERGAVADLNSNNGWSNVLTPSGLAVDNLTGNVILGEVSVQPGAVAPDTVGATSDRVTFPLDVAVSLPDDLPDGLYVPALVVAGENTPARLPLVLNVGGVERVTLPLALLMNDPSDGSRGILPQTDTAALSNRVRYNSATYILPPGTYPLEPYLPNLLSNRYDMTIAPLIPFQFPGGALSVVVTRPDGTQNRFDSLAVVQNQMSTPAEDEASLFGVQSSVDIYRLATDEAQLAAYAFDQYGEYRITVTAELGDIWGNQYTGGGDYQLVIAQPLDMLPGVLPGTPFEIGDNFNPTLHLAPGLPADVTVRVRVYPLDGSAPREHVIEGQASRYGYFHIEESLVFDTAGEYVIDYEARYQASDGRWWAGSQRSAGVIGSAETSLIAHGDRGVAGLDTVMPRPAWYQLDEYADVLEQSLNNARLNTPYHGGDVAWIGAGADSGIQPVLRVQDRLGDYARDFGDTGGSRQDALPVTLPPGAALMLPDDLSYTYFSAVRPDVTARQLVIGSDEGGLPLSWNSNDPYNRQMGVGFNGDQPGDYLFLFGGAVVRPLNEIAIYASLAVVTDSARDARIFPPGRGADGGGDGGPLFVVHNEPVEMFFHPTGTRPGDTLIVGDRLTIAGQVAPTLPATVRATITSPSGAVHAFSGTASAIGYFADPSQGIVVNEAGVWRVSIHVEYDGLTSAGQIEPPILSGDVLGSDEGTFLVYVLPDNALPLPWSSQLIDTSIPPALAYNFNFTAPDGWNNIRAYRTLTSASYILEDGELRLNGRSFSYPFNPTNLRFYFPNVEAEGRASGAAASDVMTLTFAFTGTDASGTPQIRARSFTLFHDRLITWGIE